MLSGFNVIDGRLIGTVSFRFGGTYKGCALRLTSRSSTVACSPAYMMLRPSLFPFLKTIYPRHGVCHRAMFFKQVEDFIEVACPRSNLLDVSRLNFLQRKSNAKDNTGKSHATTGSFEQIGVLCTRCCVYFTIGGIDVHRRNVRAERSFLMVIFSMDVGCYCTADRNEFRSGGNRKKVSCRTITSSSSSRETPASQ